MNKKMLMCKFKRHENINKYKKLFLSRLMAHIDWMNFGMYPDELFMIQVIRHKKRHEQSSEHNRNGMFQFWLNKKMSNEEMIKLKKLALLDCDKSLQDFILKQIENYEINNLRNI